MANSCFHLHQFRLDIRYSTHTWAYWRFARLRHDCLRYFLHSKLHIDGPHHDRGYSKWSDRPNCCLGAPFSPRQGKKSGSGQIQRKWLSISLWHLRYARVEKYKTLSEVQPMHLRIWPPLCVGIEWYWPSQLCSLHAHAHVSFCHHVILNSFLCLHTFLSYCESVRNRWTSSRVFDPIWHPSAHNYYSCDCMHSDGTDSIPSDLSYLADL